MSSGPAPGRAKRLAIPVLFLAGFTATCSLLYYGTEDTSKVAVEGEVPPSFPVLALVPGEQPNQYSVHVVYWRQLQQFVEDNPDCSFRIPEGQEEKLNEQLRALGKFWDADFRVQNTSQGTQLVELHASEDDDRINISWYETDGKHIDARHHQTYFGPGAVLGAIFVTVFLWGLGTFVFLIGRAVFRWSRKRSAGQAESH